MFSLLQGIPLFPGRADDTSALTKLEGQGPLGLENNWAVTGSVVFADLISAAIGLLTVIAFIWFFIKLLLAAIALINSGGDKAKVAEARGNITTALVGVIIVISAVFVIRFVAELMGIPDVLNIPAMVEALVL